MRFQQLFSNILVNKLYLPLSCSLLVTLHFNIDAQQCTQAQKDAGICSSSSTKTTGKNQTSTSTGRRTGSNDGKTRTNRVKDDIQVATTSVKKERPINNWPEVTFIVGVPELEISIDKGKNGVSNENGTFKAFLPPGGHEIAVYNEDGNLLEKSSITVDQNQTSFDFSDKINEKIEELIAAAEAKKREENSVKPPPINVQAIMERYSDPKTTDTVTKEDWQAIVQLPVPTLDKIPIDAQALIAFAQGQNWLANGDKVQAINSFSAATALMPKSPLAYYGLGNAHFENSNVVEANAAYFKALQLDNKFSLPYKKIADILLQQGKTREAANYYQRAKILGMDTPDLRLKLAQSLIKSKNCPAAINELDSLQKDSPSALVFVALGDCYVEQDRTVKAIEAFQKAIEIEPNSVQAYSKLGLIYYEQKEYVDAKKNIEKALELNVDGKSVDNKMLKDYLDRIERRLR